MPHPLDAITARHKDRLEAGGYMLLANVIGLESEVYELAPGLVIRRATAEERVDVLTMMYCYLGVMQMSRLPWETEPGVVQTDGGTITATPNDTHRYHVLEYRDHNPRGEDLVAASVLGIGPVLQRGFEVLWGPLRGTGAASFLSEALFDLRVRAEALSVLTDAQAADLASVLPRWAVHDEALAPVRRATRDFLDLERPLLRREIRLLGYFGILESFLIHKPAPSDPYSSITRQMKMKMKLLESRLVRTAALSIPELNDGKTDKTWSTLYDLRSLIAHGTAPDFTTGNLAKVKSVQFAVDFVREVARSVMRQTLEEPQLIADLKNC